MNYQEDTVDGRADRLQNLGDTCFCFLLVISSVGGAFVLFDLIACLRWP